MDQLMELLGNLGLTVQDAGEILGFMMAANTFSVIMAIIITACLFSFFDFLGEVITFLLHWIIKQIKRLWHR